jgi:hypothetical protein
VNYLSLLYVCCLSFFHILIFFSETTGPIGAKLGINLPKEIISILRIYDICLVTSLCKGT